MRLGEFIRAVRDQRDMTLAQVHEATGLSISYLSDIERGKSDPSLETLRRLADRFGMTVIGLLQQVDGYGTPVIRHLTTGELAKVQEYVAFLRWQKQTGDR